MMLKYQATAMAAPEEIKQSCSKTVLLRSYMYWTGKDTYMYLK